METHAAAAPERSRFIVWFGLLLLPVAAAVALWLRGGAFYRLAPALRLDHPDYRVLSPGSFVGQGYGFAAAGLVLLNLSYLVRRRMATWRLGSMRVWLDVHAATGLLAGVFAISHSALQFRNPMARVTMAALGVVLVSGVVGRFIYLFVPRTNRARLEENCRVFDAIRPGLGAGLLANLMAAPVPAVAGRVTLPKVLWSLPKWALWTRRRRKIVRTAFAPYRRAQMAELNLLRARIEETENLAASEPRAVAVDYLMRSWRGMHRFFALLMIALMLIHVGVAWYYGYRWIFSEPTTF
jgi:hypothetical protein